MKRVSKKLLDKSTDAFVLSIEIFNKPTIRYRIEGFAFFFINAWELLNKAKIIEDTKKDLSIYYKKKNFFVDGNYAISPISLLNGFIKQEPEMSCMDLYPYGGTLLQNGKRD